MSKIKINKPSLLIQVVRIRGIRMHEVCKALNVSQPTAQRYLNNPKFMNQIHRDALGKLLQLTPETLNDICMGEVVRIGEIVEI